MANFLDKVKKSVPKSDKKPSQGPKKKKRRLDIWNKLAICILTCFLVGCISVFFVLVNIINDPEGMRFSQDGLQTMSNSRIYDTNGNLLYEFGQEIRDDVKYEDLPQSVIDAFLSIEDSRFFDHNGFDLPRFLSAAITDLKSGSFDQGGSTLTMQMIDNSFTKNQEQKLLKENGSISKYEQVKLKVQEIYLSLVAEQSVSKEQIFEYYVNRIWFGSGNSTRGIQKACQYYFGKNVQDINLEEAAFLAGCINAPGQYNPLANESDTTVDHLTAGQNRRNTTLDLMLQHGYITQTEHDLAVNTKLSYSLNPQVQTSDSEDPNEAYIDMVIDEVKELTGQDPGVIPMDIYTSLNTSVQNEADKICKGETIAFPNDAFDVGFSVIDNSTGEIIAIGPGRTYHTDSTKINNANDRKQPGSSMKPLLAYCSTFDILGWSTEHTVNDKKKDYWKSGTYLNNSDGTYSGNISLAQALGVSKNTTAAQAMLDLIDAKGYNYWREFCLKLGYDEDVAADFNEQYSIGGGSMYATPIQQASAYSIFANKGNRVDAHMVRTAIRRTDNKEFKTNATTTNVISEDAAFMMSFLLYKVVHGGYVNFNDILKSSYPVYGKSGTSDWGTDGLQYGIPQSAIKDEWSVGYTSQFTIATWSGYTSIYQQQGYYIPVSAISSYTQAFKITHYMLDYCQTYGTYTDIAATSGVSKYGSGYIETQYLSKGDSSTTSSDKSSSSSSSSSSDDSDSSSSSNNASTYNQSGSGETDDDVNTDDYNQNYNNSNNGSTYQDYSGIIGYTRKNLYNLFSWL